MRSLFRNIFWTYFALGSTLCFGSSFKVLSETALFNRCYGHLTESKAAKTHPLKKEVAAGSLSAVAACMKVLESANLNPEGKKPGSLTSRSKEAYSVLRYMNDHHRNWFPSDDIVVSSPQCPEKCPFSDQLHDGGEPALHLTRALLTPGIPYSEIVTSTSGMEALRSGGPKENLSSPEGRIFLGNSITNAFDPSPIPLDTELPQFGDLLGIRAIELNPRKHEAVAKTNLGYNRPKDIYIFRSLGGGILGTRSYLLLNLGRPGFDTANGGLGLPRRWAKAVYHDLLCRDIPVIRTEDAQAFVQETITSNTPAFRTSRTCMQCHASIDPMAGTIRNVSYAYAPGPLTNLTAAKTSSQIYDFDSDLPSETLPVDADVNFHRRPPKGRLYFRSYNGELINREVTGVVELGKALAESEDLYVCAAARYFYFFTGISVNLNDPGAAPSFTAEESWYRDKVIRMGLHLKSHQTLRLLIKEIFEDSVYRSVDFHDFSESKRS